MELTKLQNVIDGLGQISEIYYCYKKKLSDGLLLNKDKTKYLGLLLFDYVNSYPN